MMFSQSICSQNEWKSRIARRSELILTTGKPMLRRISLARIEFIWHGRLERLVMRGKRSVLQTFWHVNPAQAILMQDERRIARNCIETFGAYLGLVVGRLSLYKSGNIDSRPFFGVPPDQFFAFAPGMPVRPGAGAIINDPAIARPAEAPAVTEIIS